MKKSTALTATFALAATSASASADSDYSQRALYGSMQLDIPDIKATFVCTSPTRNPMLACQTPTLVNFRNSGFNDGIVGFSLGYSFNPYIAVEAIGRYSIAGLNDNLDSDYVNTVASMDQFATIGVALRVDVPLWRRSPFGVFGRYGITQQWVQFSYDDGLNRFTPAINGHVRLATVGVNWITPWTWNLRVSYDTRVSLGTMSYSAWTIGADRPIWLRR